MPTTLTIESWRDKVLATLEFLRAPDAGLLIPPQSHDPQARLSALLDLWIAFAVRDGDRQPALDAGQRLALAVAESRQRSILEATIRVIESVDREITRCLELGADHPDLIHTAAFREVRPYAQAHLLLAAGFTDTLPQGHRLRDLLPADDFFQIERRPVLLLGRIPAPLHGRPVPRSWYMLAPALELTRNHRERQRWTQEDEARQAQVQDQMRHQRYAGIRY